MADLEELPDDGGDVSGGGRTKLVIGALVVLVAVVAATVYMYGVPDVGDVGLSPSTGNNGGDGNGGAATTDPGAADVKIRLAEISPARMQAVEGEPFTIGNTNDFPVYLDGTNDRLPSEPTIPAGGVYEMTVDSIPFQPYAIEYTAYNAENDERVTTARIVVSYPEDE